MRVTFCFVLASFLLLAHLQTTESLVIFSTILSMMKFSGNWCLTAFTGFLGFHGSEVLFSMMRGDRDKFADLQKDMQQGFERLNDEIATSSEVIVTRLSNQIHANAEFNRVFERIEDCLLIIDTQFTHLQSLLTSGEKFQNDTLHKTAESLTASYDGSVQSAMYKLNAIVNDRTISSQLSKGTIVALINYLKALHDVKHCESITAPSEVMYVFLHYLAMMQLKGMVTVQEGYNLLSKTSHKEDDHYAAEYRKIERETHKHIQKLMQHMDKLTSLSPYSFACMPQQYVEHQNFERFEKFLPIYMVSEYGLEHYYKKRRQQATMFCSEDCPFYDIATFYENPKQKIRINIRNRCWGMVRNCKLAEISGNICMLAANATQLYSKHSDSCGDSTADVTPSRYEFFQCETCQCLCDTHVGKNYIYMEPILARYGEVVTGVRFEKRNNAIFLNIETASALPFGFANDSNAHWNKNHPEDDEYPTLNRDRYYQMFHWCRHIALTDVRVAKDQVLVGVQLYPVPGKRCVFNLRVFGSQINMFNGQFTDLKVIPYENKFDDSTEVIDVSDLISGVDKKAQKVTTAENGSKLIKLSNSVLTDNFGQNTVPYFDTQPVATYPKMMQSGVGLYYRNTEKYAGHIAPRLIAFNSMEYLNEIETKPDVVRAQLTSDAQKSAQITKQSRLDNIGEST